MLETQKYLLAGKSLNDLNAEYGINVSRHPELPLVILNYDQIASKDRNHPIVRECRALCLEDKTWNLVYRSFPRFFNWGEFTEEMKKFDFSSFVVDEKVDRSLCIIYNYKGQWYGNTRGSFGLDKIGFEDFTWRDAFLKALGVPSWDHLDIYLNTALTYVCEFVSPWNKVVKKYDTPQMYHLTTFFGEKEFPDSIVLHKYNDRLLFQKPTRYNFKSMEEIYAYMDKISDPTFEGVVRRDRHGNRWKDKRKEYLALHALRGEGTNLYNPKHLIPFILGGEQDELLVYFPECEPKYRECKAQIDSEFESLKQLWLKTKDITIQKDFALAIVNKHKFYSILFQVRKNGKTLEKTWQESGDLILKTLFKG